MPLVSLHLEEVTVPDALARLRNGKLDLAAIHHVLALDNDLVQVPLYSTQFVVTMRAGHPLANVTRLSELLDAEWIVTVGADHFPHSVMMAMFSAHGLPVPKRLLRAPSSFAVTLGLVSQTDAISCFTRPLAQRVAPLGIRVAQIEDALPNYDLSMDEPTAGLDVSVQARLLDLLRTLSSTLHLSVLIVTHDIGVARLLAHRLMVMQAGEVVEAGLTDQVLDDPQHPYTQTLVSSVLPV